MLLSFDQFAFRSAPAELVGQPLSRWSEREAHRIDAITLPGRRRTVGEDMALVRPAPGAHDFRADHSVTVVADVFEVPLRERLGEAWPAGAALELRSALKKWQSAEPAREHSRALLLEENAAERRFGAMLEKNVLLLVGQIRDKRLELLFGRRREIEGRWP